MKKFDHRVLGFVALVFFSPCFDLCAQSLTYNLNGTIEVLLRDKNVSKSGGRIVTAAHPGGEGLDIFLVQDKGNRIHTLAQNVDVQKLLAGGAKQPRLLASVDEVRSTLSRSAIGDLNNDGTLDAVLALDSGRGVTAVSLPSSGDWKTEATYSIRGELSRIALGRLRTSLSETSVSIFAAHSSGIDLLVPRSDKGLNFESETLLADARGISALAIGDFDSDGNTDLLGVEGQGGTVLAFRGNGSGEFFRAMEFEIASVGAVSDLLLLDWDNDGKQDLIIGSGNQLSFALNSGSGFSGLQAIELPDETLQISAVRSGLDGLPTCVVETKNKLSNVFLWRQSDGWVLDRVLMAGYSDSEGFELLVRFGFAPAMIRSGRNSNSILLDRFESAKGIPIDGRADQLQLADLDLDGNPDIIAAGAGPDGGLWVKNAKSATFKRIGSLRPTRFRLADLDPDQWIDIVALDESGEKATVYVVPGIGEGAMGVPKEVWRDENRESNHWIMAVGDYSNDRWPDLGLVAENGLFISQLGLGNGLFRAPVRHHLAASPADAVVEEVVHYQLNLTQRSFLILDGRGDTMPGGKKRSVIAYTANPSGLNFPLVAMEIPEDCRARQLQAGRLDRFPSPGIAFLCEGPPEGSSVYWRNSYEFRKMWSGAFKSFGVDFLERGSHGDLLYLGKDLFVQRGRLELGNISIPVRMPGGDALTGFSVIQSQGKPIAQLVSGSQSYIFLHFNLIAEQGNARVVSSTSFENSRIAPGGLFTLLGPFGLVDVPSSAGSQWPFDLGGFRAEIEVSSGEIYRARIGYVSENQVNLLAPIDLPLSANINERVTVRLIPESVAVTGWNAIALVDRVSPGVFFVGQRLAAANVVRFRGSQQSIQSTVQVQGSSFVALPIDLGPSSDRVFLLLYGTGIRNRSALEKVKVRINGIEAPVSYVGAQGQYEGLDQINIELPRILAGAGLVGVTVEVEGKVANQVFISFQ